MKKSNLENHFKLYGNCVLVKGAFRSVIYDLEKGVLKFIPNLLYSILSLSKDKNVTDLKKHFNNEYDEGMDLYFDSLIEGEYGFWTDEPDSFPEISTEFYFPSRISNVILEVNNDTIFLIDSIIEQLEELGCFSIEFRCQNIKSIPILDILLNKFKKSKIRSINVIIGYSKAFEYDDLILLSNNHLRIKQIIVHGAEVDNVYMDGSSIIYYQIKSINNSDCGQINKEHFTVNIPMFTESLKFNSCLNRKLTISSSGEIKNCPSMKNSYGNIKNTPLISLLTNGEFTKLWDVSKDKIKVCQDCEFRYACVDCRAHIDDMKDSYSRPKKCTYNPYHAKWEGEEGYVSVTEMTSKEIELVKIESTK